MTSFSSRPGSSRQNIHGSLFPTYVSNPIRKEASSSSQLETWLETLESWKQRGFRFRIKCVRGKFYLTAYRKVNGKFLEKSLGRISVEQLAILRERGYVKISNFSKASKNNCKTCSDNDLSIKISRELFYYLHV